MTGRSTWNSKFGREAECERAIRRGRARGNNRITDTEQFDCHVRHEDAFISMHDLAGNNRLRSGNGGRDAYCDGDDESKARHWAASPRHYQPSC